MKNFLIVFTLFLVFVSCTSQKNSEDFINTTSGRYLFNANEVLEIYFEDAEMHAKWRGIDDIELLKVNDSSFYMKELNEKMIFVNNPEVHIELAPKTEHEGIKYYFRKMEKDEKTANEYFLAKEYDKAKSAYLNIQKRDSLNLYIKERRINSIGYEFIREDKIQKAIEIFKINVALYPKSSNTYDSLGDAYLSAKDTLNALDNYKKALAINPEKSNAKNAYEKLTAQ